MKFLLLFSFIVLFDPGPIVCECPVPAEQFSVTALDPTTNLLSGMTWTPEGLVVCDRGAGILLLVRNDRSTTVLLDGLDTPVDVVDYGNEWLILQEVQGSLIAVDKETSNRRIIAEGFNHPTAFTIDDRNTAFLTEFETGSLFRIDLKTGAVERFKLKFDRPADVLFVKPDSLYIADQVGMDLKDGAVVTINRNGSLLRIETGIIDPTGLALSPSGDVYVSTFSMRNSPPYGSMRSFNGGVVSLSDRHPPKEIVSGLLGPTSVQFDGEGNLIALEEPTDSIYRFSPTGERTSLLEGFAPVDRAARGRDGDIVVMEKGPLHQLKIMGKEGTISVVENSVIGQWERVRMAVDGLGFVYLYEPVLSLILVYDRSGNLVDTFIDPFPFFMMGIPSGGIFNFSLEDGSFSASRLKPDESLERFSIDLDVPFTTGFAVSEDRAVLCFANGNVQEITLASDEKRTIVSGQTDIMYFSAALDGAKGGAFWLLDSSDRITYWNGKELIPAAQVMEPGTLLPDNDGVLFLSASGKRFLIRSKNTAVSSWIVY